MGDNTALLNYNICMKTPMGTKNGLMTVFRDGEKISGILNILNHCNEFEGKIAEDGSCELFGKIVTLMRTIRYRATGCITDDSLKLLIADGNSTFEITGTKE